MSRSPRKLSAEEFWEKQNLVSVLAVYVSHSVHPRCKLVLFLSLRCCSRKMCFMFSSTCLIGRINLLAGHKVSGVRAWAKHVINAGWIHQVWPSSADQRKDLRLLRLRMGSQGRPAGMRKEYFECCVLLGWHPLRNTREYWHPLMNTRDLLGWKITDGVLRLDL